MEQPQPPPPSAERERTACGSHTHNDCWGLERPPALSPEVVILGASNVTRNVAAIVESIQATFERGVRLFIAHGHGRSYGIRTRVLARQLPGHVDSGLWTAWNTHGDRRAPRYALITDVGNDLLFGPRVDDILGWVGQCISRLKAQDCEIAVATLPTESLLKLSAWRYHATSRLFFPRHAVSWNDMQANIRAVDEGLRVLARAANASIVEPNPTWYGLDPIHFRLRNRRQALASLLGAWPSAPPAKIQPGRVANTVRLRTSRPARTWLFGNRIDTPQPIVSDSRHELWMF